MPKAFVILHYWKSVGRDDPQIFLWGTLLFSVSREIFFLKFIYIIKL
jgi:hypothetical protein